MDDYAFELSPESPKIEQPENINIKLKDHQLAMVKKCMEIEEMNICNFGIMSDKPGTGKTYVVLTHILLSGKKRNIIVVPQNIINQWCNAIHVFSNGLLKYKKFIEYSELLDLYNADSELYDYDILLTTALYYNMIATTVNHVERVFFDEIDSISSFVVNEIKANFVWFVSASIDYDMLGIYSSKIDCNLLSYVTCKCINSYVDDMFNLELPNIFRIVCKNIYLDNIFKGVVSQNEFRLLNAMDYSRIKKKFSNKVAQNEKEALDILVKDKIDIIEMEKLRIDDLKKAINIYGGDENNSISSDNRVIILKKQLEKAVSSLEESETKLNLIRDRLKENNCCPLCYDELDETQNKVVSECCKNTMCYKCPNNWFNKMKKTACIYCNQADVKFEDYVVIKPLKENCCILCEKEYENITEQYYSDCCKKKSCKSCLEDWYQKLLKDKCPFCHTEEILIDDFKTNAEHEEIKLNKDAGIKYTKKTKLEFMEFFIRTKIYAKCKIIFCTNYIRIFNDLKRLLNQYFINYIELDDGNINDISESITQYTNGNMNVLLLNSNLFGCGLNLECTTDIVFLHKTEEELEKQIIGRAQRHGRKNKLNLWYLMHENEKIITSKKTVVDKYNLDFNSLHYNIDEDMPLPFNSNLIYNYIVEDEKSVL
jgi:hypothetical protein